MTDWQRFSARRANQKLPHALLLTGARGMGKHTFASFLSQSLLCQAASNETGACGICDSCQQLQAESHSEFRLVQPEGASATIKVDTVRRLVDWLQLTSSSNSLRIALIEQADRMNRNAANSLLKTLEEPADAALLILVTDKPGTLPATVRSRCQKVVLHQYDHAVAAAWLDEQLNGEDTEALLQAAHGAPLMALELADPHWQKTQQSLDKAWLDLFLHRASVGRIVDSLKDIPTARALQAFTALTVAASRLAAGAPADSPAVSPANEVVHCLKNEQWFTIYESLVKLSRIDSASFKSQTVLEGLFADIRLMVHV